MTSEETRALDYIDGKCILNRKYLEQVYTILKERKIYDPDTLLEEMTWFFVNIGFNDYYYNSTSVSMIADHFECITAAKRIASRTKGDFDLNIESETKGGRIFLVSDIHTKALAVERRILDRFPDCRLETYRSLKPFQGDTNLRVYFVSFPKHTKTKKKTFDSLVSDDFIKFSPKETYQRYKRFWEENRNCEEPRVSISAKADTHETRIMVNLPNQYRPNFFTKISNVFDSYGITSNRKYVEPFQDQRTIFSFYIPEILDSMVLENIEEDIILATIMPDNQIEEHFAQGMFNAKQTFYAMTAGQFVHQFVSTFDYEYKALVAKLQGDFSLLEMVRRFRTALAKDTYTMSRIERACIEHPELIKELYRNFEQKFDDKYSEKKKDQYDEAQHIKTIEGFINEGVEYQQDRDIFRMMLAFNKHVVKTNYYKDSKSCIAFRLDPSYMNVNDYVETPFGIIFIYGKEFHGFHIRFRDIARGGVRLVRSRDKESYEKNSDFIFDENYGLAYTQQRKNKDIPEGGSKGIILLRPEYQDQGEVAFKKYIDGILDLILGDPDIIDYYGMEELLFLGPDEGTADFMEWASLRARDRGYKFWKGFTTGKPPRIGGIPHDVAGMTTNSVHQYVLDILKTRGIDEKDITKFQTGGPDGDLGSNEILISKDRTIAIVDGSGVVYDPDGLDRRELRRLARKRVMIQEFDPSKLTPVGFKVLITDNGVQLPDGTMVESGLAFRNHFHLSQYAKADLFSPNGGRPRSVTMGNVEELLDEHGTPKFKFIVEGANLFVTQDARLWLENKGVVVIKDASANKGGVTSSSLEVLASLALNNREFEELICVKDHEVHEFRKEYVQQVVRIIRENASREFRAMVLEKQRTNMAFTLLSDQLSNKINRLTDQIAASGLHKNRVLLKKVVARYVPPVLLEKLGIEKLIKRVPLMYLKAIMATELASNYIYEHGLNATEVDFFAYLNRYLVD